MPWALPLGSREDGCDGEAVQAEPWPEQRVCGEGAGGPPTRRPPALLAGASRGRRRPRWGARGRRPGRRGEAGGGGCGAGRAPRRLAAGVTRVRKAKVDQVPRWLAQVNPSQPEAPAVNGGSGPRREGPPGPIPTAEGRPVLAEPRRGPQAGAHASGGVGGMAASPQPRTGSAALCAEHSAGGGGAPHDGPPRERRAPPCLSRGRHEGTER